MLYCHIPCLLIGVLFSQFWAISSPLGLHVANICLVHPPWFYTQLCYSMIFKIFIIYIVIRLFLHLVLCLWFIAYQEEGCSRHEMVSLYEFLPALLTQIQTSCLAIIFLLKPFRPLLPGDSLINLCFSMF